jgi:hypothetical protein
MALVAIILGGSRGEADRSTGIAAAVGVTVGGAAVSLLSSIREVVVAVEAIVSFVSAILVLRPLDCGLLHLL